MKVLFSQNVLPIRVIRLSVSQFANLLTCKVYLMRKLEHIFPVECLNDIQIKNESSFQRLL